MYETLCEICNMLRIVHENSSIETRNTGDKKYRDEKKQYFRLEFRDERRQY